MTSSTMYYYTKVLSDLFLDAPYPDTKNTFRGSTQMLDFWRVRKALGSLILKDVLLYDATPLITTNFFLF